MQTNSDYLRAVEDISLRHEVVSEIDLGDIGRYITNVQ